MARFTIPELLPNGPKAGVHIARIAEVKEKVSEAGNVVWSLLAKFPDRSELKFYVTFADSDKSRRLVVFFLKSLGLVLPEAPGSQIDLSPNDAKDRLFYCAIELDSDGAPKITKFLSREEALAMNPAISRVAVAPQEPRVIGCAESEGRL
jgi:hypothetical protein